MRDDDATRTLTLRVTGMTCRHCVRDVTARLRDVRGVETVAADARSARVVVRGSMAAADVVAALGDAWAVADVAETPAT